MEHDPEDQHARKRLRIKVACDSCNLHKLKCDSSRPCGRCIARGRECIISGERLVGRSFEDVEDSVTQDRSQLDSNLNPSTTVDTESSFQLQEHHRRPEDPQYSQSINSSQSGLALSTQPQEPNSGSGNGNFRYPNDDTSQAFAQSSAAMGVLNPAHSHHIMAPELGFQIVPEEGESWANGSLFADFRTNPLLEGTNSVRIIITILLDNLLNDSIVS